MSDGGGTGIATTTVLQSLAQARAVWGDHQAGAIWDAAIVKLVLGGGSNARDLDDLSKLVGTRTDQQHTHQVGADGARTRSTSTHQVPVMEPSRLRMLPFGTGILLLRAAKPILLTLSPWTARPDADALQCSRDRLEATIQHAHAARTSQAPGIPSQFDMSAGMPSQPVSGNRSPVS
jgi:type IV secretory pathway TraG/TraD family ATPase VirD4